MTTIDAAVEADVSGLAPGQLKVVDWYGKPIWIMRRTKEQLDAVTEADEKVTDPNSEAPQQPEYAKNEYRSIKPEILVLVAVCTHRGCTPEAVGAEAKSKMGADWGGGFICPCHGSRFDLAGRVYKGSPAQVNLEVPPHAYVSDSMLLIGEKPA